MLVLAGRSSIWRKGGVYRLREDRVPPSALTKGFYKGICFNYTILKEYTG